MRRSRGVGKPWPLGTMGGVRERLGRVELESVHLVTKGCSLDAWGCSLDA